MVNSNLNLLSALVITEKDINKIMVFDLSRVELAEETIYYVNGKACQGTKLYYVRQGVSSKYVEDFTIKMNIGEYFKQAMICSLNGGKNNESGNSK